jgi:hypothetical protein
MGKKMLAPLPLSRLLDSLVISLIATLLLFTLFGTFPEQPATREIAAIDKPSPSTRAILFPFTCNATPNTCAALPACPPDGKGAICADPLAPRVDLALSVAAPGKESGGHAPALPVMPEAKPPPETETLPNVASTQADDDKTPNRCNAFTERPAHNSSQNELCAYLSSAIHYSDTCLDSLRDGEPRLSGKRAREMRILHTRLWNLKTEHALQCEAPRKIIASRQQQGVPPE